MSMRKNRNIRVRGVRRSEPDLRKLSRALIALAEAQLEADAQASHREEEPGSTVTVRKSRAARKDGQT